MSKTFLFYSVSGLSFERNKILDSSRKRGLACTLNNINMEVCIMVKRSKIARKLMAFASIFLLLLYFGHILPASVHAQETDISSFSIFATNNVTLDPNTAVMSGQIGAQNVGSVIAIEQDVFLEDGASIIGDTIEIGEGASVGDVYYNILDNNGTIRGNFFTPLVIPLDVTLPQFPTPAPNQDDREVQQNQTLTLQPGSYGNVVADEKATLILTGGTYHMESLSLDSESDLLFQGPTELIINNRFISDSRVIIGPDSGSGISASDILIYVNGQDDIVNSVILYVITIRQDGTVKANIFAPNGTIWFDSNVEGSLIGNDVYAEEYVQVTLNSGFGGQTGNDDLDGDGFTVNQGDCNDNDAAINPAAQEICDGVDNNCDGQIDEGVKTTYYQDSDGDGYGNPGVSTEACEQPAGYVTENTDCNDSDVNEHPDQTWYKDADGDLYSDGTTDTASCARPVGYKTVAELTSATGDCNDNEASINPAAQEDCDGVDNNCDSQIDEGVQTTYYADTDSDGYGDPNNTVLDCALPSGYVTDNTDCDDTDNTVNPGETEIVGNGKDDDCNPLTPDDVSVTDISITSPIDLSTINSSNIIVKGTINTSAEEIGIKVNGILAEIVGNEFVANGIFLELGENTLTAVATDKDGNTSTDSITVYTDVYQNLVSLSANKTSGVSPLDVKFSIDTQISNPITSYEMDYDGDGTIDQTIVDLDNVLYTYNQTGIYYPTITVTDDQASQYTDTVAITILSLDEMDVFFKAKWEDLRTSFISGNIDSAVALFDKGFREVYREQFNGLSSILNTIGNELGYLRFVSIGDNRAEYEIIVTREGVTYSYFLLFVRDQDGLWNIRAF